MDDAASPDLAIRAFAETIIPQDDTIGAADVRAEAFVIHYLEFLGPGRAQVLAAALDGLAAARSGVPFAAGLFAGLDPDGRAAAAAALLIHEMADLRELADDCAALVVAAFYGEWTGHDDSGRVTTQPVGWDLTGYTGHAGPAPEAVPELLQPRPAR